MGVFSRSGVKGTLPRPIGGGRKLPPSDRLDRDEVEKDETTLDSRLTRKEDVGDGGCILDERG